MTPETDLWLLGMLTDMVRAGRTPLEAANRLAMQFPEPSVRAVLREYEERLGRIRTLTDPPSLSDPELQSWYPGPSDDDRFWPALYRSLSGRAWPDKEKVLGDLNKSSTKILSFMTPPGADSIRTRGLVLGYVQSGKTTNFTALISKAADVGYRLFVVLSGTTNALRRQTQIRLDKDLVALNHQHWISLTSADKDFGDVQAANVNSFLTDYATQKTLCVIKKNTYRMKKLLGWLGGATPNILRSCPVLLVDDEADQASLNSAARPDERSAINRVLIRLLTELPKVAYVGYTATPFANVFVDPDVPEDLYPRDFIVDLPRPAEYFGPERFFGRERLTLDESGDDVDGIDAIRSVTDEEATSLQPPSAAARFTFQPPLCESLKAALEYFLLATAARYTRGQSDDHSTMLIHTTGYTQIHHAFAPQIESFLGQMRADVTSGTDTLRSRLSDIWASESSAVPSKALGLEAVSFDRLWSEMLLVLERAEVRVENSVSARRLDFGEDPQVCIAIGGNVLSRGLTLDGLVVSFFIRSSTAYDTLLQMGRWFGYKRGFEDLCRIWMTDELKSYFYDLATVEQEIRYDIARYERDGLTPTQFAVRIRTHPQLSITSKLKMQHAVSCSMSYSGRQVQTIQFRHTDAQWLRDNIEAGRSLIAASVNSGLHPEEVGAQHWLIEGVRVEMVLRFLDTYNAHPSSLTLRRDLLSGYIRDQNSNNELLEWRVCVLGQERTDLGSIDLGLSSKVSLINRSRFQRLMLANDTADIKALMSKMDIISDYRVSKAERETLASMSHDLLVKNRTDRFPGIGLLVLYPISKNSAPARESKTREALNAADHVLGVSWIFPEARMLTPQSYMSVDLSNVPIEEPDWESEQ